MDKRLEETSRRDDKTKKMLRFSTADVRNVNDGSLFSRLKDNKDLSALFPILNVPAVNCFS